MDDLTAAWTSWTATLAAAGFDPRPGLRPPADPAGVAAAQARTGIRFPADLAALYTLADGQGRTPEDPQVFPQYRFLPVADALVVWGGWDDVRRHEGADGMADHAEHVTVRAGDPVRREYWLPGWWPLAEDGGGNVLVVDTDPAEGGTVGQIVVAGPDEDERRRLAPGVTEYLRAL
ncbi:SMI1/KNR4 family protein, partial [Pseudonocardia abyssalis]